MNDIEIGTPSIRMDTGDCAVGARVLEIRQETGVKRPDGPLQFLRFPK